MNPGRRGGKPATNRLSYGAAFLKGKYCYFTVFRIPVDYLRVLLSIFLLVLPTMSDFF
jgi:hypothetical protein